MGLPWLNGTRLRTPGQWLNVAATHQWESEPMESGQDVHPRPESAGAVVVQFLSGRSGIGTMPADVNGVGADRAAGHPGRGC